MVAAVCGVGLVASLAAPATAEPRRAHKKASAPHDEIVACETAYNHALAREQEAHLVAAKESWLRCARPSCGPFFQQECITRFTQLDNDIPSVVPTVSDASGAPRTDVEITVDGQLLTSRLDGRALAVDPGVHEFSFGADGGVFAKQRVLILQGQRNRPISASLHAAPTGSASAATAAKKEDGATSNARVPARSAFKVAGKLATAAAAVATPAGDSEAATLEPQRADEADRAPAPDTVASTTPTGTGNHIPIAVAVGSAGLASIATGALLVYWGRKDNDMLAQCASACAQSGVDHIKRLYLGANVAFGVGLAALATSFWVYTAGRSSAQEDARAGREAYRLQVAPTSAGALASLSGRF